ncbi:hypothetical protein FB384_000493 [Prauserella sediminis]|uniref:DUF2267 domain-containing protein n=1 Tax=Prauserella sediminis TaxID=577680 RepID=A0A839XIK4_9PSEU|nr:hypothetical protein [Prauserella sediminis]MBB3661589.1 hypothetical protein [Prauserella sediminis]
MPSRSSDDTHSEADDHSPERVTVLGLIADPDMPETIAAYLAESLPEELDGEWRFEVDADPVTATLKGTAEILDQTAHKCDSRGWTYAICITDLPVRSEEGPVVADIDHDRGVAVVSVPGMGGLQTRRRVHQVIRQVLDELRDDHGRDEPGQVREQRRHGLSSRAIGVLAPIRRKAVETEGSHLDVRYVTPGRRGRLRLLTGMVRTNRPWRLVFGLSRALAAAVATSAFGLSSSTIWMVGDQLNIGFKVLTTATAIAALVTWLIAAHSLWEKRGDTRSDPQLARLYNASTLLTLIIGVVVLLTILFVVNFVLAWLILPASLLTSMLGSETDIGTYLAVAWAFTTLGGIAGALGSSLETDHAVRQAAYGYRESRRRAEYQEHEQGTGDG